MNSTGIIGILIGIIGILVGAVTGLGSKNKSLAKDNNELEKTNKAQEEIFNIISDHSKQENTRTSEFKSGTDGIIKKLMLLFCFAYLFTACSYYKPVAPKLYLIDKPKDFTDIEYIYQGDLYCFDETGIKELMKQLDWCSNAVSTYERQIKTYNEFLKGIKQ